jgi:hypothetical protein
VVWAVTLGARSYREVSERCGWISPGAPFEPLRDARRLDLVTFEDRLGGTLRPRLEIVAFTPPDRPDP